MRNQKLIKLEQFRCLSFITFTVCCTIYGCLRILLYSERVVVVLLFYVHGNHLRSWRDGQLTLGRLRPPERLTSASVHILTPETDNCPP